MLFYGFVRNSYNLSFTRILLMISSPLMVLLAVLNEPNPIPGLTHPFSQGWSCSTILFCRNFTILGNFLAALSFLIAFGAGFLSTVVTREV